MDFPQRFHIRADIEVCWSKLLHGYPFSTHERFINNDNNKAQLVHACLLSTPERANRTLQQQLQVHRGLSLSSDVQGLHHRFCYLSPSGFITPCNFSPLLMSCFPPSPPSHFKYELLYKEKPMTALTTKVVLRQYQFQILRKLSQLPVATAIPSSVTPKQLTRLSWPAKTPARSPLRESQTLQLKSSYPASSKRPLLEKATDVIPQIMLSCEYMINSWSALMSKSRQVASSEPVANA